MAMAGRPARSLAMCLNNGTFAINRSGLFVFGNVISGTGAFQQKARTTIPTYTATRTPITGRHRRSPAGTLQLGMAVIEPARDRRQRPEQCKFCDQPFRYGWVRWPDFGNGLHSSRTAPARRSSPAPTPIRAARRSAPARCRSAMAGPPADHGERRQQRLRSPSTARMSQVSVAPSRDGLVQQIGTARR